MISRKFKSPHLLDQSLAGTTRARVFGSGDSEVQASSEVDDTALLLRLKELVRDSLGEIPTSHTKKRRKKEQRESEASLVSQDSISFRLVSSSLPPNVISLSPKPPPPSKTREPECEDNEAEAEQRMRRAQSIAVDVDWILQQSSKPSSHRQSCQKGADTILLPTLFQFSNPGPPLLLIPKYRPRTQMPPQNLPCAQCGPGLSSCDETHYDGKARCLCIPPVPFPPQLEATRPGENRNANRRRRMRKKVQNERMPATFWRPDPLMGGKSAGYAWGY